MISTFLLPNFHTYFHTSIFSSFSPKSGLTMVNAWQELDVCRSKQKKLARIGGRLELIYWIEQSIWRLEVYPMSNCCWHHVVCLSTMASNSNVIKVDFEYTSTVVAKLVVKNSFFLRFPLMYPARCQPNGSPLTPVINLWLKISQNHSLFLKK